MIKQSRTKKINMDNSKILEKGPELLLVCDYEIQSCVNYLTLHHKEYYSLRQFFNVSEKKTCNHCSHLGPKNDFSFWKFNLF